MLAEEMVVDEQARTRFETDGYWLGPEIFDAAQREELAYAVDEVNAGRYETGRDPLSRFWSPGDDPYALHKVDNSHWCNSVLADAVINPRIGQLAAQLLDTPAVRLWHEQILMKPAGGHESANVAWHQDYNYWRSSDRPQMLTAWIPLQEVNPELGTMHFVKGSNKWGWHEEYSHFGRYDMAEQERVIRQHMPAGSGVPDSAGASWRPAASASTTASRSTAPGPTSPTASIAAPSPSTSRPTPASGAKPATAPTITHVLRRCNDWASDTATSSRAPIGRSCSVSSSQFFVTVPHWRQLCKGGEENRGLIATHSAQPK